MARAESPNLESLRREWMALFPPAVTEKSVLPPQPPLDDYSIVDKEFLITRVPILFTSKMDHSLRTIRQYLPPVRQAHAACVKIITPFWHGAGVVISPDGDILTSYHLVAGAPGASILTLDGRVYNLTNIQAHSITHDLALLKIPASTPACLTLTHSASPAPGAPLYVIGHPDDVSWKMTPGLALRHYADHGTILLHFESDIACGNSGGPIIDAEGRLCAITACIATLADGSKVKAGVDIEAIRQFVNAPRNPTSFSALVILDKNRRMADFLGAIYGVLQQWMKEWTSTMALATLEGGAPASVGNPETIQILNTQRAGETCLRLVLLKSLMTHCDAIEDLDPQLHQSLINITIALDQITAGYTSLPSKATSGQMQEALVGLKRRNTEADIRLGMAMGILADAGKTLDLPPLSREQQNQVKTLRKINLSSGCHADAIGPGG